MSLSKFRPCIDLHGGRVKQIVGGTLSEVAEDVKENFISDKNPSEYADLFRNAELKGGHVIKLGAGNDDAAKEALSSWKDGLQVGGGVNLKNAQEWINTGASHVIITSALFSKEGAFKEDVLRAFKEEVGKERLVVDLSCKKVGKRWVVAMDRWQKTTNLDLNRDTLDTISEYCDEFLIHAADVEGLCGGMDVPLVQWLGEWSYGKKEGVLTYAGGISSMAEIDLIQRASGGKVDFTVGSALDIFGGSQLKFDELVSRHKEAL